MNDAGAYGSGWNPDAGAAPVQYDDNSAPQYGQQDDFQNEQFYNEQQPPQPAHDFNNNPTAIEGGVNIGVQYNNGNVGGGWSNKAAPVPSWSDPTFKAAATTGLDQMKQVLVDETNNATDYHFHEHEESSCGRVLGAKALSCIIYFFGLLGGVVGVIFEKKNRYVLANAWQALFIGIPCTVICFFFAWTRIGSYILWSAYALINIVLIVLTLIKPYEKGIFKVSFLGRWAEKRADARVSSRVSSVVYSA